MRTQGFVPKHLHMIYNTFYTIGNTGEGEKLNEMEDWLYEDGADANFTVYRKKREELQTEFTVY